MMNTISRPPLSIRCRMWGAVEYAKEELHALGRTPNKAKIQDLRRRAVRLLIVGRKTMDVADTLVTEELSK